MSDGPDIVVQLLALERQGEDYIWRPAMAAREEITRLRSERDSLAAELAKAQAVSPDGDVYTAAHLQILLDDRDAFIVEQGLFSKYAERTIPAELRAACDGSYGAASTSEPQKKESET